MSAQGFSRCPCCGWVHKTRAIESDRQLQNIETGYQEGFVWTNVVTSTGRGGIQNAPENVDDDSTGRTILDAFAERARRFLEWYDARDAS